MSDARTPWIDRGPTSTIRRSTAYLLILAAMLVALSWGNDYRSCQRSAFWARYFNRQAQAFSAASTRATHRARNEISPALAAIDRAAATQDARLAQQLRVVPLSCLRFPLPAVPARHNL